MTSKGKWEKLIYDLRLSEKMGHIAHLDHFVREHLESNPIESLVDTEDPQFGADFLGKIERFIKSDGSGYMEVDRGLRLSCPKL